MKAFSTKIDLNTILQLFNGILITLLIIAFYSTTENRYVNDTTIIIAAIHWVVISISLIIEKQRRNPFAILLILFNLAFFQLRVLTLTITEYSRSINLSGIVTAKDLNHAFFYIVLSFSMLIIGLFVNKINVINKIKYHLNIRQNRLAVLMLIPIFFIFLFRLKAQFIGNELIGYALRIIPPYTMMFISIIYIMRNKIFGKKNHSSIITLLLVVFAIMLTIIGSRKVIMDLAVFSLIGVLTINNKVNFKISTLLIMMLVLPLSLFLYDIATYFRYIRYETLVKLGIDYSNYFELLSSYFRESFMETEGFNNIFDRLGFLDFATESITSHELYKPILNPIYYFQSIIDDLSPGITIFNTPLAGQIKQFLYNYGDVANFDRLLSGELKYSSQMFSGYAELFILFGGYASLPIYTIIGYFFVRVFNSINSKNLLLLLLLKSSILLLYFGNQSFLESFGFDWMLSNYIKTIIGIFFIYFCLQDKNKVAPNVK